MAWRLDDFTLAAICYADDVVLIAVSVSAAETMVSEAIEKLKEVGLTVGAQKTHWTSFPKMMYKNITVDGSAVVWEEVLEFVGSMVCLDGNARHAIAHRTAQANKCRAYMETCVEFPMAPQIVAAEHRKDYDVAGFLLELECLDDVQGTERDKIASWSARMVANVVGVKRPPGMELGQWWGLWSSMDRAMQYECAGGHQRSYAQLGWPCGKDGLQRNLREGSEMSRPSMVEMETAPLERSGERQMVWPTPTAVQNLQVGGHGCWGGLQVCWKRRWSVENSPGQYGLVVFLLKTVEAGSNFRNVRKSPV